MRSLILMTVAGLFGIGAAVAQDTIPENEPPLMQIMRDVRADEWDAAFAGAEAVRAEDAHHGDILRDIILWRYLRAGEGNFGEYQDFIARNSDWPNMERVYARGEATLDQASIAQVLMYFQAHRPQTGAGALALATALRARGQDAAAEQVAVNAWIGLTMSLEESEALQVEFSAALADLHVERLDMLLWRGEHEMARAMMPLVDEGWRALAEARIALRLRHNGVDALIEAVPDTLRDHPGLAYERFVWRDRAGLEIEAAELAISVGRTAQELAQPQRWSDRRRSVARYLMRQGQYRLAYDLASSHGLSEGQNYADLEWLSGYLALRFLDAPDTALDHFTRFQTAVWTPISMSRAGYWTGRAHEANGDDTAARLAYQMAAQHHTAYYGQLAAERIGVEMDASVYTDETFADWRDSPFPHERVLQISLIFLDAGERNLAEWFLVHFAEGRSREEYGQLIDMYLSYDEPHLAVRLAKQAVTEGQDPIMNGYFPLHALMDEDLTVPPELALAIARRESEFDPDAISPVGARGLMQVMPDTAREVAGDIGVNYAGAEGLYDWRYNLRLGDAYLAELSTTFDDSYAMVAAGYNAGPSRPRRWAELFGDPRLDHVDVVDWVEHIPFRETRNYVMRVMESLPVYRARILGEPVPFALTREMRCGC